MVELDGHGHQRGPTARLASSYPPGVALGRSAWALLTLEGRSQCRTRSLVVCQGPLLLGLGWPGK